MDTDDNDPSAPLTPRQSNSDNVNYMSGIRLYDEDCTLEIGNDLVIGFLVLLTCGKMDGLSSNGKNLSIWSCCVGGTSPDASHDGESVSVEDRVAPEGLALAFASLTDGNMIDACFGINTMGGGSHSDGSKFALDAVSSAKESLRNAADADENVKRLAINAYSELFRVVVKYNNDIEKLNVFTLCYRTQKLKEDAEKAMEESFISLNEVLGNI